MSAYDFDPAIEGTEALMRWAQAAHESLNGHSASERLYGQELLRRAKVLIDDILAAPKASESTTAGYYL